MSTKTIHHLLILPQSAKTACGKDIIAYYPISNTAMVEDGGAEPINVTVGTKGVNCEQCKKRMKE